MLVILADKSLERDSQLRHFFNRKLRTALTVQAQRREDSSLCSRLTDQVAHKYPTWMAYLNLSSSNFELPLLGSNLIYPHPHARNHSNPRLFSLLHPLTYDNSASSPVYSPLPLPPSPGPTAASRHASWHTFALYPSNLFTSCGLSLSLPFRCSGGNNGFQV